MGRRVEECLVSEEWGGKVEGVVSGRRMVKRKIVGLRVEGLVSRWSKVERIEMNRCVDG